MELGVCGRDGVKYKAETLNCYVSSVVKCSEVLKCNDGTSNKVSNIIISHIDNRKLLLICILLLSHPLILLCSFFINTCIWLYSCLIL
jgi:hypothetical protein